MFRKVPLSIIRSFISKIKHEKLVQLVGFIIRIYHDARSPERRIYSYCKETYSRGHT